MSDATPEFFELTRLDSAEEAKQLRFLLATVGIASTITPIDMSNGVAKTVWLVEVETDRLAEAQAILAEERKPPIPPRIPCKKIALHWLVGLIVVNVCVFIALEGNGGSENHQTLLRFGASQAGAIVAGQWWRMITAMFLHIGGRHLLGNMAMLGVLGPTVLRQWGAGRFYLIYLLAGLGGNAASFFLSSSGAIKAGASGAILGLLGALAGYRIRTPRDEQEASRFKTWHVVAMLIAFYGFAVGVGRADHLAHIGGIVFGGILAFALPRPGDWPPRKDSLLSWISGSAAITLVVIAGGLALLAASR